MTMMTPATLAQRRRVGVKMLTLTLYHLIYNSSNCVCVCVCVFVFCGHVFCSFATKIGTHTRNAQRKVFVKEIKKYAPGSLSRGRSPRKNFSMTQTLHIPVHSNTLPHQSCVDCMHRRPSQSFQQSNISCRRNLLFY